jgi:hypothetical protein
VRTTLMTVGQGPLAVAEVANSTDGELWRVRP